MKKAACFRFGGVSVFEFDQFWSVDDCSAGKRELGPTAATVGRLFSLTFYPLELKKTKQKRHHFLELRFLIWVWLLWDVGMKTKF